MSEAKTPVLCVAGPTASGKSALALRLARALGGEIISMDSMQLYRGMDVGTAKPTPAERALVPHHMIDILEPTESFSVAQYAVRTEAILRDVWARGHMPLLVGGTGFYLRALTDGLTLGGAPSDERVRARLKAEAAEPGGKERLHERLRAVDEPSAQKLHPNDVQRVCRALEVYELTGQPISRQEKPRQERPFTFCLLGVTRERAALYERCDRRVDEMMAAGLPDEVRGLLARGVPTSAQAMQGIGYKELVPALNGELPMEEAVRLLKQNTRHYAKRQWTWFRAEERIQWLDMAEAGSVDRALRIAEQFCKEQESGRNE